MKEKYVVINVEGRRLSFDKKSIYIDDLFDKSFYEYSNRNADRFYNQTYGVNEIYDYIVFEYLALNEFIKNNVEIIDHVDVSKAAQDVRFYFIDICRNHGIRIKGIHYFEFIANKVKYATYHFGSCLYLAYLMFMIPYTKEIIHKGDKFSILRYPANFTKTKNFSDIYKEYESPYEKKSIYRFFPRINRVGWVIKAYVSSFKTMNDIKHFYKPRLGEWSVLALNSFYKKRIVHTELFKCLLEHYFPYFRGKCYYSVYNLDRFSIIEDRIAHTNGIKTYNIPHGIEYGHKYPKGFSSDVFYALTDSSADSLNKLYNTEKFVYDQNVVLKLLRIENVTPHSPHIVFFTEPREVYVNIEIIKGLVPKLRKKGWELYLKLHPSDKISDYENLDAKILTDYSESLCNNICISRKSTILLEAIYNNSVPVSIITNVKDQTIFDNFPSLQSEKIIKTHSVDELVSVIENYYPHISNTDK